MQAEEKVREKAQKHQTTWSQEGTPSGFLVTKHEICKEIQSIGRKYRILVQHQITECLICDSDKFGLKSANDREL